MTAYVYIYKNSHIYSSSLIIFKGRIVYIVDSKIIEHNLTPTSKTKFDYSYSFNLNKKNPTKNTSSSQFSILKKNNLFSSNLLNVLFIILI